MDKKLHETLRMELDRSQNLAPETQARLQLRIATILFQSEFPDVDEAPLLALGDAMEEAESRSLDPKRTRDTEDRRKMMAIAARKFFTNSDKPKEIAIARKKVEDLLGISNLKRLETQWLGRQSRSGDGGPVSRGRVTDDMIVKYFKLIEHGVAQGANPEVLVREMYIKP